MKIRRAAISWIGLVSDFIPRALKCHAWCMWEYRTLHSGLRRIYGTMFAYELSRVLLDNYQFFSRLKDDSNPH